MSEWKKVFGLAGASESGPVARSWLFLGFVTVVVCLALVFANVNQWSLPWTVVGVIVSGLIAGVIAFLLDRVANRPDGP